mmetsp:Transcript_16132/g.45187  ORF Transcript_16132/g.45187 Transcript_16132/m.45187 type:complete len:532 (+) Transcript_16132:451-2046(+)
MAGNSRKGRGGNHHQRRASQPSNGSNDHDGHSSSRGGGDGYNGDDSSTFDFHKGLMAADAEVEGSFHVTWREILVVLASIVCLAFLSIVVGIAAGMTISIHYFESNNNPMYAASKFDPNDPTAIFFVNRPSSFRRVTTLDPTIATRNYVQPRGRHGLDLGRVITTNENGQLDLLMVVDEFPPLPGSRHRYHDDRSSSQRRRTGSDETNGNNDGNANGIGIGDGNYDNDNDAGASDGASPSFRSGSDRGDGGGGDNNGGSSRCAGGYTLNVETRECEYDPAAGDGSSNHGRSSSQRSHITNKKGRWNKRTEDDTMDMYETPGATQSVPFIEIRESSVHPITCPDKQRTIGFDSWKALKAAVQEANAMSAERFMKWNEYFARSGNAFTAFQDDALYYEEDVFITICPGAVLKARRGPIFINAENILIECDDCVVDVGGTHLAFGPHAKNVVVRGVTFRNAHSSSLTFFHDGAQASFEDCRWESNSGLTPKYGAVADVNSTSIVTFYRCEIGHGQSSNNVGPNAGFASSLSIRA